MRPPAETCDRLARALEYPKNAPSAQQEQYSATFDFDPSCSLDVGWHLFGDAVERGALLARLRQELARAGISENGELPDHLPTLLRLLAREDEASARNLAALMAPAVACLAQRLRERCSPFSDVVDETARLLDAVPDSERPEELP
jgi:nitrate reductase molybdenum cofactor assembly chaperone